MTETCRIDDPERRYLHAWLAILQDHWEEVLPALAETPCPLLPEVCQRLLKEGTLRRRRPICLLLLAEQARQLAYPEEATVHLQHCLTLLNERRMNIPEVRVLAHLCQGRLALHTHQLALAYFQFETARKLYEPAMLPSSALLPIVTGLCETLLRQEHYAQALHWGQQALDLLPSSGQETHRGSVLLLLSQISLALHNHVQALTYAREAHTVASHTTDSVQRATALLLQAEGYLKAGQQEDAQRACQQVLALVPASQPNPRGMAFWLLGRLAEQRWEQQLGQSSEAQNAVASYEEAQKLLQDPASLARVSRHLAHVLEASGHPDRALVHWKRAYHFTLAPG